MRERTARTWNPAAAGRPAEERAALRRTGAMAEEAVRANMIMLIWRGVCMCVQEVWGEAGLCSVLSLLMITTASYPKLQKVEKVGKFARISSNKIS